MKIRQGFVSNSSSSSFIVDGACYKNVFELATVMVAARGWDNDEEIIGKIINHPEMDLDHPLCFHTCNYNTYICKDKAGNYAVQTCNNHAWNDVVNGISHTAPSEYREEQGEPGDDVRISKVLTFWHPEYDLMGYEPLRWQDRDFCKYHFRDFMFIVNLGHVECPKCYSEYKDSRIVPSSEIKTCNDDGCHVYMIPLLKSFQLTEEKFPSEIMWCPKCGKVREIVVYPIEPHQGEKAKLIREWKPNKEE